MKSATSLVAAALVALVGCQARPLHPAPVAGFVPAARPAALVVQRPAAVPSTVTPAATPAARPAALVGPPRPASVTPAAAKGPSPVARPSGPLDDLCDVVDRAERALSQQRIPMPPPVSRPRP